MNASTAAATTAARLLGLRFNDAARNSRPLSEISAVHFWDPGSGGGAVIVGADGTYLLASPAVAWDKHLEAYSSGRRSTG